MADNNIPQPVVSVATDHPLPDSSQSFQHIAQDANGNQFGTKDGTTWVNTKTGQPYNPQTTTQPPFEHIAKDATGNAFGYRNGQWVNVVTNKPYQAPGQNTPANDVAHQPWSFSGLLHTLVFDPIQGIGEGALDTVHTIDTLANKAGNKIHPGLGDWLAPPTVSDKVAQISTPDNTMQSVGKGIEGLGEFVTGDEALKGLSLAERLGIGAKIAKLAESHPVVAKIINAGLDSVRTGTASGAQSAAHGESAGEGFAYGAGGATVAEGLGAGAKWLGSKVPSAIEAAAKEAAEEDFVSGKVAQMQSDEHLQRTALTSFKNTAANVADSVIGRAPSTTDALIRHFGDYTFGDAANEIRSSAKPVFEALDKESNNTFSALRNQEKNALNVLRNPSSVQAAQDAEKALADTREKIEDVISNSKINSNDLQKARDSWRKASTLDELHSRLDKAFTYPQEARNLAYLPAEIKAKTFKTQLDNSVRAIGEDKLKETLGSKGLQQLYDINEGFSKVVTNDQYRKAFNAYVNAAGKKALAEAAPSLSKTASYSVLSPIFGAGTGAAIGAAASPEDRTAGAVQGATIGGLTGLAVSPIVGTGHWLYSHPEIASKAAAFASKRAIVASQALKQQGIQAGATHVYDPEKGLIQVGSQ